MNIIFIKLQRMFNFNLQNKAFEELNAEQFRVVYFLNNSLSMVNETNNTPNNNTIEMYNGYMMDKLGLSERQVQRLIKSIEEVGFINVKRAKAKKQPNKITINNAINGDKNGDKNVTLNKKEIRNNKNNNITTGILEHKDLEPEVTEDKENKKEKVNEMKTSTSEDQNKNEVKVNSPKVMPSSNEDNNTGGKAYIPKNYEVNSPTSPSEDDMTFEEYTEQDLKERGLIPSDSKTDNKVSSPKVRPSSTETSNKATGDVQSSEMEQLPTNDIKTQPDAKEMSQEEREEKIASIMTNIELDKDGMFKAKGQPEFDGYFADFQHSLANLKHLVSEEAYKNYRSKQGRWWKATVKYLVWYEDPTKKPTRPTVKQMSNYQYHMESMRIAKKIEDLENALNRIENWFEKMEALYTKNVMQQYWDRFENDCASVKRSNPIFEEWQKHMNQTA